VSNPIPYESDRPNWSDDAVLARAAAILSVKLGPECRGDEAEKALARAMAFSSGTYDLARSLDLSGWMIDDEILEELGNADMCRIDAHRELVARWVEARHIRPQRDVGAAVSVSQRGQPSQHGEVVAVDLVQASYTVFCPGLGHVREGLGTHGIIVPYESVHALCPAPETFELEAQTTHA
jgi:hypothetical protein